MKGEAMCVGSLFSGIGGLDLGLERAGMQVAWQVEIDEYCRKVLTKHWPDARIYEDVKTVGKQNLKAVDVVCGGFPCQDVSVAGRRAGLDGSRSGLWWEFHRVISEINPTWVIIENVPGLLSSNGGRDMGAILRALGDLGYGWAYRVLDAQYFGVAQRRRRVFIVGCLGDRTRAAKVLFEPESCGGGATPSRKAGRVSTSLLASGAGTSRTAGIGSEPGFLVGHTLKAKKQGDSHDPTHDTYIPAGVGGSPHLAHALRSQASRADKPSSSTYVNQRGSGVRRLTPTECERLQGFPDGWTLIDDHTADTPRYRALGNAVAVPVAQWIAERIVQHARRSQAQEKAAG